MKIFIFLFIPSPALMKLRCIPSPASKSNNSPPLTRTIEDKQRQTVGAPEEVPRKTSCISTIWLDYDKGDQIYANGEH
jgi:hypothetical protein